MSSQDSYERMQVRFNRLQTQGVIYGLSYPALFALLISTLIVVISIWRDGLGAAFTTAPVWAPIVFLGVVTRRGVPLVVVLGRWVMFWIRSATGEISYRFEPEEEIEVPVFTKRIDPALRPMHHVRIPGRANRLDFYQTASGAVVVHDTRKQTASIAANIATGPFMGRSAREQDAMVQEWSRVIGSWTMRPSIKRFNILEQTRPGTTAAAKAHWVENGIDRDSEFGRDYAAMLEQAEALVVLHRTMLVLTLDLKQLKTEIKANGAGVKGLLAIVSQEITATTDTLSRAGFTRVAWLNVREYLAWGRTIQDPDYTAVVDARSTTDLDGVAAEAAGSMAVDDARSDVITDSGFHRTYWIHQWPRMETYPGFLEHVVFAELPSGEPVRHVFNLVARPVGVAKALKRIEDAKKGWRTNERLRQKAGREASEADKADWQNLVDQEQALVSGHGEVQFSAYITVTGRSRDELEAACSAMRAAIARSQLEAQVLYNQQAEALLTTAFPVGLGMK